MGGASGCFDVQLHGDRLTDMPYLGVAGSAHCHNRVSISFNDFSWFTLGDSLAYLVIDGAGIVGVVGQDHDGVA